MGELDYENRTSASLCSGSRLAPPLPSIWESSERGPAGKGGAAPGFPATAPPQTSHPVWAQTPALPPLRQAVLRSFLGFPKPWEKDLIVTDRVSLGL